MLKVLLAVDGSESAIRATQMLDRHPWLVQGAAPHRSARRAFAGAQVPKHGSSCQQRNDRAVLR